MIIITNNTVALIYYSASQWLDAEDEIWPADYWGFKVPNSTTDILGTPQQINPETGEIIPGTPPMTQAQVAAIATETIFQPETSAAE
jgi:hypothetical protein